MGYKKALEEYNKECEKKFEVFKKRADAAWKAECEKAKKQVFREFGAFQKTIISGTFKKGIQEYYDAYPPDIYRRENGLYKILDMNIDEEGFVDYGTETGGAPDEFNKLYNREKMPDGRYSKKKGMAYPGTELFEKVFMQGWHGGAESGDGHPDPDTPYYRTGAGYSKWGEKAARTDAPFDILYRKLTNAEDTYMYSKFEEIAKREREKLMNNFNNKILPKLVKEVLGGDWSFG